MLASLIVDGVDTTGVRAGERSQRRGLVRALYVGSAGLVMLVVCGGLTPAEATTAVTSPLSLNPGFANDLVAVSADSATDVWAVGSYQVKRHSYTLVERWDGTTWHQVKAPTPPGKLSGQLSGVSALSPTDVWAVGSIAEDHRFDTWVLHWNGKEWRRVPSPNPAPGRNPSELTAVTAVSANDVWAVGHYIVNTEPQNLPLVEHWDGSKWRVVSSASLHGTHGGDLSSITATSADDVWAAGVYFPAKSVDVLMEHWDGHSWTRYSAPSGGGQNWVGSVSADSSRDVWMAGWVYNWTDKIDRPVLDHWDGSSWQRVPAPNPGARYGGLQLAGVSAIAPDDAWAVGTTAGPGPFHTITEHWDGNGWTVVQSAPIADSIFAGVTSIGPRHVFAVGSYTAGTKVLTLAEAWNGAQWNQI